MVISVVNHTNGQVSDEELQSVVRAVNRQIQEDFAPYWSMTATLRLEGRSADQPDTITMPDVRGDAILYLWDQADVEGALGYHFQNNQGIPFGFVFTEIARSIGEPWSVTLSHEALELLADPETNLLVMGPHPTEDRDVFHWYEVCDAVQAETYAIDDVAVSNFLLPLYFTGTRQTDEVGARNDFLGKTHAGQTLTSFGVNPGGYVGFFDPELGEHDTFTIQGDSLALQRLELKGRAKEARRSIRYREFAERKKIMRLVRTAAAKKRRLAGQPLVSVREQIVKATGGRSRRLVVVPTAGAKVALAARGRKSRRPRLRKRKGS